MGEQLNRFRLGIVGPFRGRDRERAGVDEEGEFAIFEQGLEILAGGVEAVLVRADALRVDSRAGIVDGGLGDRHLIADLLIIAGLWVGINWNDEVVGIQAAAEKEADQRFVVAADIVIRFGRGSGRLNQLELSQNIDHAAEAESGAGGLAKEVPAGRVVEAVAEGVAFHE